MMIPFLLPMSEGGTEIDGISVILPPVYEIFWSAVALLILWVVIGRSLPKIYAIIDKRRDLIDQGLDASEAAKEEAALARRERADVLREATDEAREIRNQAAQDAKRIIGEARQQALVEAAHVADTAQRQILAETKAASLSLRRDVGDLATELAEKIIGEQLEDKALSARVIDRFMDDLENQLLPDTAEVDNR